MKVLRHGRFWINENKQIQCPECNSNRLSFDSIVKEGKKYCVDCTCDDCDCFFIISRVED